MGRKLRDKAEIASRQRRVESEGLMAVAEACHRSSSTPMVKQALPGATDYPQIPELGQRGSVRLKQFFATLDKQSAGRSLIAAGQISIADLTAVVAPDHARMIRLKPGRTCRICCDGALRWTIDRRRPAKQQAQ